MRTAPPLLVALLALALAACGAGGGSAPPPSPAQAVRDAYGATVAAGGSQVTVASRTSAAGQDVDVTADGGLDPAAGGADLTVHAPSLGTGLHVLFVGGTVYAAVPPTLAALVPGGKAWASVDLDRLTAAQLGGNLAGLGGGGATNPARQLGYLQGLRDDARVVGPEPVDGTPTTHYAGTVDLDRVPAAGDPATRPAVDRLKARLGTSTLPVEVWVDGQGRLKKVTQTVSGAGPTSSTSTLTFVRVGVPVSATAPPPDQVTDLGRLLPTG